METTVKHWPYKPSSLPKTDCMMGVTLPTPLHPSYQHTPVEAQLWKYASNAYLSYLKHPGHSLLLTVLLWEKLWVFVMHLTWMKFKLFCLLTVEGGDITDHVAGDGSDQLAARRHQVPSQRTLPRCTGECQPAHVTTGYRIFNIVFLSTYLYHFMVN